MQRKEGIVPGTEIARVTEIAASGIEAVIEKVVVIETGATKATDVATAVGIEEGGIRVDTMTTQGSFHRPIFLYLPPPSFRLVGIPDIRHGGLNSIRTFQSCVHSEPASHENLCRNPLRPSACPRQLKTIAASLLITPRMDPIAPASPPSRAAAPNRTDSIMLLSPAPGASAARPHAIPRPSPARSPAHRAPAADAAVARAAPCAHRTPPACTRPAPAAPSPSQSPSPPTPRPPPPPATAAVVRTAPHAHPPHVALPSVTRPRPRRAARLQSKSQMRNDHTAREQRPR
jgi:hypothetical protein